METAQVDKLMVEVTRMESSTREIMELLTAQQKVLSMRGINIDAEIVPLVSELNIEFANLHRKLTLQQPELAQLRALVRSMSLINSTLDLDQVLNDVMDTFIELTDAERSLIVLIDADTGDLDFRVVRGMDESSLTKGSFMVSRTVVQDVATKGEPVITTNALEDKRYSAQESIISYAVRSIICVPLKDKDKVIGVAYADHRYKQELFGDQELQFLVGFANQAAIAIENARLFDNVQQRLAEIIEIQNFLDNIFSSIISGIITLDNNGTLMTINRAAENILHIAADSSLGRPYTEILPSLYDGFDDLLQSVLAQGTQQIIEINPVMPERGPVNLNLKISPLIDADSQRIQGVTIVIDDLTELKKNDETLRVVNTYLSEEMVKNIESIDNLGLGGDAREISAIFADVRGFTTFSENLSPEELMEVINQYLAVSSDSIMEQEGVIDKFMGDAVLGLFNTQLNPQADHALRCVTSAIAMILNVQKLHETLPPHQKLYYGIGIHTGLATIGNVGSPSRKEFTAIGDGVAYAKKLQECADGGEIILSEATYQLVKDRIQCERTERQFRGEDKFVEVYKVLGQL